LRWCADDRAADVQKRLQQVLQGVKDLVLLKGEQWVRGHLYGIIGASQGEGGLAGLKDTGYWVRKEPPQDEVCNRRWETAVEPRFGIMIPAPREIRRPTPEARARYYARKRIRTARAGAARARQALRQLESAVPLPRPRAKRAAQKKVATWAAKVEKRIGEYRGSMQVRQQDPETRQEGSKEENWARAQKIAEKEAQRKEGLEQEARRAAEEAQQQRQQQQQEKERAARVLEEIRRAEEESRRGIGALPKGGKAAQVQVQVQNRQGEDKPRPLQEEGLQQEREAKQRELLALKAKVPETNEEVNKQAAAVREAEAELKALAQARKNKKKNERKKKRAFLKEHGCA
jgi:hypothetical protein